VTQSWPRVPRFEDVTEAAGTEVSAEGASMIATRYHFAAELAQDKRVLELACGSGMGLGLIGRSAAWLVGADISASLLGQAQTHYRGRVPFVRLSAESLPFADGAFDVVLCLEASYYVPRMDLAFREIARVVAPGGTAVFVNANPERPDFIKSPHSLHYHSADEFRAQLGDRGFSITGEGAFPVEARAKSRRARWIGAATSLTRRALEILGLVPRTLRGRARLKRLVYGKLRLLPPELPEGFAERAERKALAPGAVRDFKVIYVTARKRA
jgi:SAM-dependent methyltransferase